MTSWEREPVFTHLRRLTDARGVFEHASFDTPRREHGYCVDDVARALIVLAREPHLEPAMSGIASLCLSFVESAVAPDGRVRNRMSSDGRFTDRPGTGDWWGRAVWSLGVAFARLRTDAETARALAGFARAARVRSPHVRAMAFAALGAAEVLRVRPADGPARDLLRDAARMIRIPGDAPWPWPEPRLRYANAVLPEALLAAGDALGDDDALGRGLSMLRFLLEVETTDGRLSVTGSHGRGPGERGPQFDQQPIEVAAIADACARAFELTGDSSWRDAVGSAWRWFLGENDTHTRLFDPETGAGYDGLTPEGRNENRGAESTLAMLSTFQQARRLGALDTVAR
ncbi:glycosyltransferase [Microbacterium sp. 4R-513]|uniref:glycosyltransferase n=1 Tax=Microbacterium sp. 4R-513 TaxID=2567934 RepID=UPI0013E15ABE|nr:glycosyltransferase [Microbacterium sp. 4R-513]QIG40194.1 glycosyltransferase [Microbacterium sp. 4R-513]